MVKLLNTKAIENLVIFVEKHCAKLNENIPTKINNSYYVIDIFETLNAKGILDNAILVSFDISNMFHSIEYNRGVAPAKNALDSQTNLSPFTECIIEALEICLTNNNSTFSSKNLIQINGTAMNAANSCSYSDLAIQPVYNAVIVAQKKFFQEILYFIRYRDACMEM